MISKERLSECQNILNEAKKRIDLADNEYFDGCLSIKKKEKQCRFALEKYINSSNNSDDGLKFLLLALNYDKISIEETYKNGVFKPSTFSFQYPQIIFEHLFSIYSLNFTSKTVLTYIDSLLSLIRFSLVIFRMRQELLNVISKDKESFLKGVLAYAELFFLTRNVWHFENDQIVTPEEIGEACSYIASLYFDKTEILPARNCDIDTNKLKEYMGAILSAHIIKQYLYAEMMIGKLPYFA